MTSKIEWTDETWNCVVGCTKVSAGCDRCYAMREAVRLGGNPNPKIRAAYSGLATMRNGKAAWTNIVRCLPERLEAPLHWRKPRMVFVNSMSDLFHEAIPDEFIDRVFAVMALCPQHTFQVFTKRPERMRGYLSGCRLRGYAEGWAGKDTPINRAAVSITGSPCAAGIVEDRPWPLPNVWLLVSVEDQPTANQRIPILLDTPAAVRGLSLEPCIGQTDLVRCLPCPACHDSGQMEDGTQCDCGAMPSLDWIIMGGESGPGARPMHPDWVRSVRDQCAAAGVPFFFKQGSKANWPDFKNFESFPEDLQIREYPNAKR